MLVTDELKEKLYLDYYNKVVRFICSQTNDYNLAEDMASDIFVKIFDKLSTFDETKSSLSTWIYTLSRNHLYDYYKTRKVEAEFNEDYMTLSEDEEEICTEENLETLADALSKLNDKEKTLIIEHYYNKVSLKKVAEQLGISYIYAKVMHAKALGKIRKFFKI